MLFKSSNFVDPDRQSQPDVASGVAATLCCLSGRVGEVRGTSKRQLSLDWRIATFGHNFPEMFELVLSEQAGFHERFISTFADQVHASLFVSSFSLTKWSGTLDETMQCNPSVRRASLPDAPKVIVNQCINIIRLHAQT
jgi:hypothetical protein